VESDDIKGTKKKVLPESRKFGVKDSERNRETKTVVHSIHNNASETAKPPTLLKIPLHGTNSVVLP
jgi:hypothetical protein